jgi:hypothetical protein
MERSVLTALTKHPDKMIFVFGNPKTGEIIAYPFKCEVPPELFQLLNTVAIALLGKSLPSSTLPMEDEFPNCLRCRRFLESLPPNLKNIASNGELVPLDVFSRDLLDPKNITKTTNPNVFSSN